VNYFSSKSRSAPAWLGSTRQLLPATVACALLGSLVTAPAQTKLSSSQVRSEVSRLSANDQRQDLRLYSLEKDVDYLQRKGAYSPRGPSSISAKAPVETLPTATTYTVRPGDTVWRIAMNHRVSPGEIIQLNGLKSDTVTTGQTLKIPAKGAIQPPPSVAVSTSTKSNSPSTPKSSPGGSHTIQSGETFSQIAQKYGLSQTALKQANPKVNPNVIIVGAKLNLPSGTTAKTTAPISTPTPSNATPPVATTSDTQRHTVRSGDTLSSIASTYRVSTASIQRSNTLANPDRLKIGQIITIPSGTPQAQPALSTAATPAATPAANTTPAYPTTPLTNTPSPALNPKISPGPAPQANPRGVLSYRVHSTDTLESIASTFGTTPDKIRELNRKPANSKVTTDEEILVPAMAAVSL
jgi:LysM repeat protein